MKVLVDIKLMAIRTAVVVLIAAAATVAAPGAYAATNVGRYAPASVTCDSITNEIKIQAMIGASDSYDTQRVAYELYAYDATRSGWIRLNIDDQQWHVVTHYRVTRSYDWSTGWMTTTHPWAPTPILIYDTLPDGAYYIYTRYIWEAGMNSNVWVDTNGYRFSSSSPWTKTTGYNWMSQGGGFSYCQI